MGELVDRYLSLAPPEELYQFLRYGYQELERRAGQIVGLKVPVPKLVPLAKCA